MVDTASLLDLKDAVEAMEVMFSKCRKTLSLRVRDNGQLSPGKLEVLQHEAHGLAWLATYLEVLRQTAAYALRLDADGRFGALESALVSLLFGEYLAQVAGGIFMSQSEVIRPADLGLERADLDLFLERAPGRLIEAVSGELKAFVVDCLMSRAGSTAGDPGLDDVLDAMRAEIAKFTDTEIIPHAQAWHLANAYVPIEVIEGLSDLGVFALTLPEAYRGLGLGKVAMCVVSEELSRGYLGVGSLGTRSEIAAELILGGGTEAQKQKWLPELATGACLPAAVFTEPDIGSDLASLTTRATRAGDTYRIKGNKTWITHAARSDMMMLLARTNPDDRGYGGLSMFLAEKPRGHDWDPFPARGMSGSEIGVIGYRGMKEYEIAFDDFEVPRDALLGGREGEGFKQLMGTLETARIQTSARALGVAQSALDLGLGYASVRTQFGKPIVRFPRVANKLAIMAAEILGVRQLTYFAARRKDQGARCDLEAGMAKLLAARVAWSAADGAVQIHGGNGFAEEFPVSRILCDARILSIFEGASEIQAQVIARRLLAHGN